jgi:Kinesin motor domain
LSFVDLAGSEKAGKTGTDKEGAAEGRAINQSLSALGNVISALSKGNEHIPYRDHPLTMLMKDSIGGTAKTLMFVNVSPSNYNESESKNSMEYATRVKKIKNKVAKNIESNSATGLKKTVQDQDTLI